MRISMKLCLGILLSIAMMLGAANLAHAESGVSYVVRSWDGSKVVSEKKTCTSYSRIADVDRYEGLTSSWYVADVSHSFDYYERLDVYADTVNLIIRNDVTLSCEGGIHVPSGKNLNIYFESGETGKLIALGDDDDTAAIGGDYGESGGNVTIHGGNVMADGYNEDRGEAGAGIGGGKNGSGGTVIIYGGTVEACGSNYGAGIGSGDADREGVDGGIVKIYGGNVTAKAGYNGAGIGGGEGAGGAVVDIYGGTVNALSNMVESTSTLYSGAGIGSGCKDKYEVNAGTVRVHGGNVTAQGGQYGAGIGGGYAGNGGTFEMTDGTVNATGGECAAGIGGGYAGNGGSVTIKHGTVTTAGNYGGMGIGRGEKGDDNGSLSLGESMVLFGDNSENPGNKISTSDRYQYMTARFSHPYKFHTSMLCMVDGDDGYKMGLHYAEIILKRGSREVGRLRINSPDRTYNDFTIYASDYADTIYVEGSTQVVTYLNTRTLYGGEQAELKEAGSLREWAVWIATHFYCDYTVDNLPEPVFNAPTAKNGLVYTGSAQELINKGGVTAGGSMQYALGKDAATAPDDKQFSTSIPTASNAGTYYVWYRVTSGRGFKRSKTECLPAITIGKAKLTITANDQSVDMGNPVPDLSRPVAGMHYTVAGLIGKDNLKTAPKMEYQKAGVTVNPGTGEAGTYDIAPSGAAADNYDISYENGTLKIKPVETEKISYQEGQWDAGKNEVVYTGKTASCKQLDADSEEKLGGSWYYVKGDVTFDDVRPEVNAETVNIILCDNASLKCEEGISVPEGCTLNIYSQSFGQSMGKLDAYADGNSSAGIGGTEGKAGGTVNIHGGKIFAIGDDSLSSIGKGGAGIGGGARSAGTVNIYGGEVTAWGASEAAGIGGGNEAAGGTVNIYGGKVDAKGGSTEQDGGAGIGGGDNGTGGTITIYGGDITAKGGADGAGIGGGDDGAGGTITITGGDVKAYGGSEAAGIGGGDNASGGVIRISGGSTEASGGSGIASGGAGIGGGQSGDAGDVIVTGGNVSARAGMGAAGIGCGEGGEGGSVEIKDGTVNAESHYKGAGIGSGNGGSFKKIVISGGTVTAIGGENAAGIGSGRKDAPAKGGMIEISGGEITARGGADGAGIGGGTNGTGGKISVSGGSVYAYGGTNGNTGGAGIGGGKGAAGGEIDIYDKADIKEAKGGQGAAGIGGGAGAAGGDIRISKGAVSAAGAGNGAGIGGGENGDGGAVSIKGGQISATGGAGGAGIGGGKAAASGAIRIYEGTVTATGGDAGGAGIGTGALSDQNACDVIISGGTVVTHGGASHTKISDATGAGIKNDTKEGAGIGAGGAGTRSESISGNADKWGEEAIVTPSYFSGKIAITGGTVTTDLIGSSADEASGGNQKGTVEFSGGTINVHNTPVRADQIVFADDVRVRGVTADQREDRCKEGDSLTVEKCPHDNLSYVDVDEKTHSLECKDCLASLEETEAHSYGEPAWNWDENGVAASASFTCVKCGHTETREAEAEQTEPEETEPEQNDSEQAEEGRFKAMNMSAASEGSGDTAAVTFEGETYTDDRNRSVYDILMDDFENGSVEAPGTAAAGEEVIVKVTPGKHYHIAGVSVNGEALTGSEGSFSFTMPKGNVKVSAEFEIDTVQLIWVSRDYVYDYENDEYTDETVDTVVYTEEVPYGTEGELPGADEFAALYGYCGLETWEVKKGNRTSKMKPGEKAVADEDVTLTAIWREHNFTYSTSEDGATIKATCLHDDCALTNGELSLTIRRPALTTYGDTSKGFKANAILTLDGLDAFIEYAKDLQAFMEYGDGMDASREYDEIKAYYKEHADEYREYADEIDAYIKELEEYAALVDGWADKYIRYYKANQDSNGVYSRTGSALKAAPTEAGSYMAELEIGDINQKIYVGYTIDKADPLFDKPEGLTAEFGQKLRESGLGKTADGTWSWNEPEKRVTKQNVYHAMATFTPEDTNNYNVMTYVRVPVKVEITTESNVADKALAEAAKAAVEAVRKNPTEANVNAAYNALAKISTFIQKAIYGRDLDKDLNLIKAVEQSLREQAAKKAAEEKEAAKKAAEEKEAAKKAAEEKAAAEAAKNKSAAKKAPKVKIKTGKKTLKASGLKKKARSFKIKYTKSKGSGKVTFKKLSGNKKLTVTIGGKVKVKKGTGKGKYTIKVKLKVAAKGSFKAKTVKKTIKVIVK